MNKKALILFAATFFTISTVVAQVATTWRGPNGNGTYPDKGLLKTWPATGPEILWHFDQLGDGFSSPVVANGMIYLSGAEKETGFIYALSLDGKLQWKSTYGEEWTENYPGSRTSPTVIGNELYIYSGKGVVTCLNAKTGKQMWQKDLMKAFNGQNITWGVTESVVVDNNKLFVTLGGAENNVIAINRMNGDLIWSCKGLGETSAYCTPLLIKLPSRKLLVTMTAKHILGIDAESGKLLWSHEQTNQWSVHANTPIFYDNAVFCFSGYGQGGVKLSLNADGSQATQAWFSKKLDSRMGGAVVVNGFIYGSGDNTRDWQCTDWSTGVQKYASQVLAKGNVIYADGMLFCYSEKGELALVPASTDAFNVVSKVKVELGSAQHWSHPVINDGKLLLRHGNTLIAYKIK